MPCQFYKYYPSTVRMKYIWEVCFMQKVSFKDQHDFADGDFNTPGLFIKYSTNTLESSEEKWLYQGESFLAEVKGSIFRKEILKIRSINGKFSFSKYSPPGGWWQPRPVFWLLTSRVLGHGCCSPGLFQVMEDFLLTNSWKWRLPCSVWSSLSIPCQTILVKY